MVLTESSVMDGHNVRTPKNPQKLQIYTRVAALFSRVGLLTVKSKAWVDELCK